MSFSVIFEGLGTCFENKEEISNFMKMFYTLCNFHQEKFEGVIFHLYSMKFTIENAKNDQNYFELFLVNFECFKLAWEQEKTFKFSRNVLLHAYFLQRENGLSNISSSVPKTYYKMQKMSKMTIFLCLVALFRILNSKFLNLN